MYQLRLDETNVFLSMPQYAGVPKISYKRLRKITGAIRHIGAPVIISSFIGLIGVLISLSHSRHL